MKLFTQSIIHIIFFLFLPILSFAASGAVNYAYDEMNRLIRVSYGSWGVVEYTYDATGNRLNKTIIPTDSDNDGLPDIVEDANQNGIVETGETNPENPDTDGDGIQDGTESGVTNADIGPDTNTTLFQPDLDPTTVTNPLNADTDNDGLTDGTEDKNLNGRLDSGETDPNSQGGLPWLMILLSE